MKQVDWKSLRCYTRQCTNCVSSTLTAILSRMRLPCIVAVFALLNIAVQAQQQPPKLAFEVASVRPSQQEVGPDYNNQITDSPAGFTARNVTLKRLIAEAWHCQLDQITGPSWLDHNEFDIAARLPDGTTDTQIPLMIRTLLFDRFHLKEHEETRPMRVYELTAGPGGPRIHPIQPGDATATGAGFHFRGDMRHFADLLAVQFSIPAPVSPSVPVIGRGPSIPVLDKTGLQGIYEFSVDLKPEVGTDGFTGWKRVLEDQLGLKIASQRADVPMIVVEDAAKIPVAN
jgi:uncharacterized protein (TIGR03435 family)